MSVELDWPAQLRQLAHSAADRLEGAPALEIIEWAVRTFGDDLVVATSLQDAVVIDLASQVKPGVDVAFLNTGYHFAETIGMRDAVRTSYPVRFIEVTPEASVAEQDAEHGPRLYERDPDLCCSLRKVRPLGQVLAPYSAWVTGLRRAEALTRRAARPVEWDERRQMVKVNPIVAWSDEEVETYIAERGILVNPLHLEGYRSIGCAPCTRPALGSADPRAGRWAGTGKVECGLHA